MSACIYSLIISKAIYLIIVPLLYMGDAEEGPCTGYPYGCCPNTIWDTENSMCKDCAPGYFWMNCSKTCPFPLYGNSCNRSCPCNETECDFKDGCRKEIMPGYQLILQDYGRCWTSHRKTTRRMRQLIESQLIENKTHWRDMSTKDILDDDNSSI